MSAPSHKHPSPAHLEAGLFDESTQGGEVGGPGRLPAGRGARLLQRSSTARGAGMGCKSWKAEANT